MSDNPVEPELAPSKSGTYIATELAKSGITIAAQLAIDLSAKGILSASSSIVIESELSAVADVCARADATAAEKAFRKTVETLRHNRDGQG